MTVLGRIGMVTKGVVYLFIGAWAALAAFGEGGRVTGKEGVLLWLGRKPLGNVLVVVACLGLLCYALWRCRLALEPRRAKWHRFNDGIKALLYFFLILSGVEHVLGQGLVKNPTVHRLFDWPGGKYLVMLAGLIAIGFAIEQITEMVGPALRKLGRALALMARAGLLSRAVLFTVIGGYLVYAGATERPGQARGFAGALRALADRETNHALMAAVAIGLVLYGVYEIASGLMARLDTEHALP